MRLANHCILSFLFHLTQHHNVFGTGFVFLLLLVPGFLPMPGGPTFRSSGGSRQKYGSIKTPVNAQKPTPRQL